ncbi:MAG: NAD(P)H-hydrate dehydratase, partial [Gemmatimonadota bacterium]|nr:NAD(P)H-hydrate dehydratase [Gemmatimonadota bacterium]
RGGAGVVRIVSAPENREVIQSSVPAAVFVPWDDVAMAGDAIATSDGVAIGPGLGRGEDRRDLLSGWLEMAGGTPCVLDADALNAFEGAATLLAGSIGGEAVLTPHPGEMRRLVEAEIDVLSDPPGAACGLASATGVTVVLKGAPTWVAEPDGSLRVTSLLSPAFAAGGTGDVLTGLIGAYAATGIGVANAASAALMVSGIATIAAGDPVGHSADDVPAGIPGARAELDSLAPGGIPGVVVGLPAAGAGPR